MVRVLSQPTYPSGRRAPVDVIQTLSTLKQAYSGIHQFWTDEVTLTDSSLFATEYIASSRQVADVYLLGLAKRRGARVVSFDRSMAWQAIRGGRRELVVTPDLSQ